MASISAVAAPRRLDAVRIHEQRVFPVKSERHRSIDSVIAQVQSMMAGKQPLWIRRAISRRGGVALEEQSAY